jgi:hypothetical protein
MPDETDKERSDPPASMPRILMRACFEPAFTRLGDGREAEAFELAREQLRLLGRSTTADDILFCTFVATEAGHLAEARVLLRAALRRKSMRTETALALAAHIASSIADMSSIRLIMSLATKHLPNSELAFKCDLSTALRLADYGRVREMATAYETSRGASELTSGLRIVSEAFLGAADPDYRRILDDVAAFPTFLHDAVALCLGHAKRTERIAAGVQLVASLAALPTFELAAGAFGLVEQAFLIRGDPRAPPDGALIDAIAHLVDYTARTDNSEMRNSLASLLDLEKSGTFGVASLAALIMNRVSPIQPYEAPKKTPKLASPKEFDRFLKTVYAAWEAEAKRKGEKGIFIGLSPIPDGALTADPHRLLAMMHVVFSNSIGRLVKDELDVKSLSLFLGAGLALARLCRSPIDELHLMHATGQELLRAGFAQSTRDLVEHALTTFQRPADRGRAWVLFSDLYSKLHGHHAAAIGLACALAFPPADARDTWDRARLTIRFLRQAGFDELALGVAITSESFLKAGRWPTHEIDACVFLKCTVQFQAIHTLGVGDFDVVTVRTLLNDLGRLVRRAGRGRGDLEARITFLAQVSRWAADRGIRSIPTRRVLAKARKQLTPQQNSRLRQFFAPAIRQTVPDIRRKLSRTRLPNDLSADLAIAGIAGRRALRKARSSDSAWDAALAVECMSDHALGRVAEREEDVFSSRNVSGTIGDRIDQMFRYRRDPARPYLPRLNRHWVTSPSGFRRTVNSICRPDRSLHFVGADDRGAIVRVDISQKGAALALSPKSSAEALIEWAVSHPAAYGETDPRDPLGNAAIIASQAALDIGPFSISGGGGTFIVDLSLPNIPINLIPHGDLPLGLTAAVGVAPSLDWLIRAKADSGRRVERIAWLPPTTESFVGPMVMLRALEGTVRAHGFKVIEAPPAKPAEVVIVGAHGGLHPGGRFFRRLNQEGPQNTGAESLAEDLAGTSLVVLLVCSGGRGDIHPLLRRTSGFARSLLDHGCRAVVASPWSLDAGVPLHWLPAFLDALDAGKTAAQSAFVANAAVAAVDPLWSHSLAMHTYGLGTLRVEGRPRRGFRTA